MFVFHDPAAIFSRAHWKNECENNPGGPSGVITQSMLVGAREAEINFERARIWARKNTPTGLRIMDAVRNSKTRINVIAWRSRSAVQPGFSMFSNDSPLPNEGTIFVNLDQLVSVATPNPEDINKNHQLNNFILILHEIGHAKQFIDHPVWFRRNESTNEYVDPVRQEFVNLMAARTGKAWGHQGKVDKILGNPHKAFDSAIEWDNYIYHEGPICDEVGVARRIRYSNISMQFGDTHSGGSTS